MGVRADGDRRVVVDLVRPATDFPAVVSAPPFAVVSSASARRRSRPRRGLRRQRGYVIDEVRSDGYVLRANEHYWSGEPPIATVHLD